MKVSELIQQLYNYNQDAEVRTPCSESIKLSHIFLDSECNPMDQRETPIVFVMGCDYEQEAD